MNREILKPYYEAIEKDMAITLATAADDGVSMRVVSPVPYGDDILIFTDASSKKYRQLKANPRCCLEAGHFFIEADAEFFGPTLLPENAHLREAYCKKFADAFDEGVENGGRNAEFILLHPTRISGWAFEGGVPGPDGIPTVPVDIAIERP